VDSTVLDRIRRAITSRYPDARFLGLEVDPFRAIIQDGEKRYAVPVEVDEDDGTVSLGKRSEISLSPVGASARGSGQLRDAVIEAAVRAGKFTAARADHWRREWDRSPAGTKALIDALAASSPDDGPIAAAVGYPPGSDEYAHLFPPEPLIGAEQGSEHLLHGPSSEQVWAAQDAASSAYTAWREQQQPEPFSDADYRLMFRPDEEWDLGVSAAAPRC
jgi:hypothetical protein